MFKKYDSNLNKRDTIYRGIGFSKSNKNAMLYYEGIKSSLKASIYTNSVVRIDKTPASFSKKREIANGFGKIKNRNYVSIIYELKKRYSNEIDIKKGMNSFANQEEIIIRSQKATYQVLSIKQIDYDTIVVEIIERED